GVLEFIDHRYNVAQNSLPVLSNISINPYPALKTISATYFDADADFPLIAELELDNGSIYSFVNSSFNFSEPVSFVATVPNTELWQNATIRFSDNNSDLVLENIFVTNTDFLSTQAPGISCLMPNPLRQSDNAYLTLGGLSKGPLQIELYNIKGQKVSTIANLTVKAEEIVLPFGTNVTSGYLSPGMYILRITQTDRTLNKKIIITR
ncbi:MAG: T9SS type A sorting domain-containing protein, partial [Candidatus Cloacimonadaceae bacterium]|nr:T9SS type A sorting domain-containing protein [Candidatus Cloacimonadaceae bacterium]